MDSLTDIRQTSLRVDALHRASIARIQNMLKTDPTLADRINKVDKTFVRKIQRFPSDITAIRIAKVIDKLFNESLM